MKKHRFVALLIAGGALAFVSAGRAQSGFAVREFVRNADISDWTLAPGWTWSDGVLSHWNGLQGPAQQVAMPPLAAGRTYRIVVTFANCLRGSVTVSLGAKSFPGYCADGTFTLLPEVSDPTALLTLTPTIDYEGSISRVRVVELGEELIDKTSWTIPEGWSQQQDEFRHNPTSPLSLEGVVGVVPGRIYRIYFGVTALPDESAPVSIGTVALGGTQGGWFYQKGNWNYSFDLVATAHNRVTFTPHDPAHRNALFDGTIRDFSVREITSDPVPPPATKNR